MNNATVPALYKETLDIRANEVDVANRWKASAIFSAQQEVAEKHCRFLHCSHHEMAARDAFFVLMRQRLDFVKYPCASDLVECTTWVGTPQRTAFSRFHSFDSPEGEHYGTVSAIWMICSLSDRRILQPASVLEVYPDSARDDLPAPGKLRFPGEPMRSMNHIVSYSDMDYNGHANNTRYVEWCMNFFDIPSFFDRELSRFQINYVSELRGGEDVHLDLHESDDGFSVRGRLDGESRAVFEAAGAWRSLR